MILPNPTDKRLTWIAKTYPWPVLYDTITAFAEATAMHSLATSIRDERAMWQLPSTGNIVSLGGKRPALPFREGQVEVPFSRLSAERAVLQTKFYMNTATGPMLKSGHTPYDRYLPWVATQLSKVHRALLKQARRQFREELRGSGPYDPTNLHSLEDASSLDPYSLAIASAMLAAPDLEHAAALAKEYKIREPFTQADRQYQAAAVEMVRNFRAIVEWADDQDVDLGEHPLASAIDEAREHAEAKAEEENWADVADSSRVVYEWPDGWTIQELLTTNELVYEGNVLRHCIKDYTVDDLVVGGGVSRVYSLRNADNRPVVTMEWKTDERLVPTSGLRGFANKTPEMAELSRMYEFRRRCQVFDQGWKPQSTGLDSVRRGENWLGRYTRRIGRDVNGNSLYESVDVYTNGVYDADRIEWELAALLDSAEQDDSAYEECVESDYPDWEPARSGDECEPCREWADQQNRDRMEDLVRHFDPEEDLSRADLATFDFELDPRVVDPGPATWGVGVQSDLNWLHWLVTGQGLPGWDETDEMQEWLDELHTARALLPGMPPHRDAAGWTDGHPHRMVTGPPNVGWVRRSIPTRPGQADAGWQDQQLHPPGRAVGVWCVSNDLVDAPGN